MYNLKYKEKYEFELQINEFQDRYIRLIESNKKNIIYIKEVFENSTFRYRTYNVIETMEKSNKYKVHCFLVNELYSLNKLFSKIDLIILQRAKWSFELVSFINVAKDKGIKIVYDMDDLIYDPKYVAKYLNSIGDYREFAIDSFYALSVRYNLIAKYADAFIVTTKSLEQHIKKDFNKPVWILPNYLNVEQENISKKIVELKKKNYDKSKFVIGYFSGSNSHKRDLEIVEPAIMKLMKKYDDIYLKIVGYMELNNNLEKYKKDKRIIFDKFVPYEELQYKIGEVDLNIVPLQNNEFNACKSELKYFESAIVKTPTIATNNNIYSNIIEDGVNGFLANEMDWYDKIEYVYLNRHKIDNIIDNAYNKCYEIYGNSNQIKKIEKIYDEIGKLSGE